MIENASRRKKTANGRLYRRKLEHADDDGIPVMSICDFLFNGQLGLLSLEKRSFPIA